MFEDEVAAARGSATLLGALITANHHADKLHGCRKLHLAAEWADLHTDPHTRPHPPDASAAAHDDDDPVTAPPRRTRAKLDVEEYIRVGGAGTPTIAETCPAELGVWQQQSTGSARCLIADALDLRHRLPRLWDRVLAGEVHAWKARAVAQRTRWLSPRTAASVDTLIAGQLELLSWGRLENILDATILQLDPTAYHTRAAETAARRDVWVTDTTHGYRTLIARATTGDVAVFLAITNRIADCLADEGDEDPANVRRSKAIGILANPAATLDLLLRHTNQPDNPAGPWNYDPDPDGTNPWKTDHPCHRGPHHSDYRDPDTTHPDHHPGQEPNEPETPEPDRTGLAQPETPTRRNAQPEPHRDRTETPQNPAPQPNPNGLTDRDETPDPSHTPPDPHDTPPPSRLTDGHLDIHPPSRAERNASRPRIQIVFHLTDRTLHHRSGIVRTDAGPITAEQLRQYLTDTDANITVLPVLDPAAVAAVDNYEIPLQLRRAIKLREPHTVFPYGTARPTDLDHTHRYQKDGPPGQTRPGNLGPLTRSEHRAKTVGRWQTRQPEPGTHLWRSPHGWIALTTNQGTLMLGNNPYAQTLWTIATTSQNPATTSAPPTATTPRHASPPTSQTAPTRTPTRTRSPRTSLNTPAHTPGHPQERTNLAIAAEASLNFASASSPPATAPRTQ